MSENTQSQVVVRGLYKKWSEEFTLGEIDLKIDPGSVVGILGHNGSGKTTLFEILSGNLDATEGRIEIQGQPVTPERYEVKKYIGYLPQNLALPKWVSGYEVLRYGSVLRRLPEERALEQAIAEWDCAGFIHRPIGLYSHGMQKRIGLSLATLHDPEFLILDEPFSGLDLFHIHTLHKKILSRKATKRTTILSTHTLSYVAKLCERVFILKKGQLKEHKPWDNLGFSEKIESLERSFFSESL